VRAIEIIRLAANAVANSGYPFEVRQSVYVKLRRVEKYLLAQVAADQSWGRAA
jgi:hypothetical protein